MSFSSADGYTVREGDTVHLICDGPQTAVVVDDFDSNDIVIRIEDLYGEGGYWEGGGFSPSELYATRQGMEASR